jgi:hypothetical protein
MNAAKLIFDVKVAIAAADDELAMQRSLGFPELSAFENSFAVLDGVLDIARGRMPAEVLTKFRLVGRS